MGAGARVARCAMRAHGTRVVASTYHCDVVVLKLGSCGRRVGRVGLKDYKFIVGRRERVAEYIGRYLTGLVKRRSIGSKGVGGLELGWYM